MRVGWCEFVENVSGDDKDVNITMEGENTSILEGYI